MTENHKIYVYRETYTKSFTELMQSRIIIFKSVPYCKINEMFAKDAESAVT